MPDTNLVQNGDDGAFLGESIPPSEAESTDGTDPTGPLFRLRDEKQEHTPDMQTLDLTDLDHQDVYARTADGWVFSQQAYDPETIADDIRNDKRFHITEHHLMGECDQHVPQV